MEICRRKSRFSVHCSFFIEYIRSTWFKPFCVCASRRLFICMPLLSTNASSRLSGGVYTLASHTKIENKMQWFQRHTDMHKHKHVSLVLLLGKIYKIQKMITVGLLRCGREPISELRKAFNAMSCVVVAVREIILNYFSAKNSIKRFEPSTLHLFIYFFTTWNINLKMFS